MAHIIRAGAGKILGPPTGCRDRFVLDSRETEGRLALVEHLLAPHSIAAPVHRHTREDEISVVLEGRVWFSAAGEEHVAEVGDVVVKPRGEWHTFWNATDSPARILEVIHPRRPRARLPDHGHLRRRGGGGAGRRGLRVRARPGGHGSTDGALRAGPHLTARLAARRADHGGRRAARI